MQHNFIALAFRKVVGLIKEHKDDETVGVGPFQAYQNMATTAISGRKTHKLHKTVGS